MGDASLQRLSAFAVHRKLIPGFKSYEDHNPTKTKRKPEQNNALLKNVAGPKRSMPVVSFEEVVPNKKAIQRQKKHKLTDNDNLNVLSSKTILNSNETLAKRSRKETNPNSGGVSSIEYAESKNGKVSAAGPEAAGSSTIKRHAKKDKSSTIKSLFNAKPIKDSQAHGRDVLEWIISPATANNFLSEYWEKKPYFISGNDVNRFKWIMSSEKLDEIMRDNKICFGKNVDITSYDNKIRETHNPDNGRALPATVWDFYCNGCSVRFLNPQSFIKPLWKLNSSLQEFFSTFVGSNAYLTPPNSQGFAPHYDDIEAFILQIEGKKHWKLYAPRTENEILPRFSSKDFNEEIDNLGIPVLDIILEEGDVLYFPRGWIHQAKAVANTHSLHLTLSCYQQQTYGDLLKQFFPIALERAQCSSVKFRKGLPTDFLSFMGNGVAESDKKSVQKKRKIFHKIMTSLVQDLAKYTFGFDTAADQLGKKFMWDSLPPYLNLREKDRTVYGGGEFMVEGHVHNRCEIGPDVDIKLIRKHCLHLVLEENLTRVYHSCDNSLEYHEGSPEFLEIPEEAVEAIKCLIKQYPKYTKIQKLPIRDDILKLQLASDLWEKGLLMTKVPLLPIDSGEQLDLDSDDNELSNSINENLTEDEEIIVI